MTSCGLFNTRNPEEPDMGKSTYYPPTVPDTVVSNFKNAIAEKNITNFIKCFWDTSNSSNEFYEFLPSPDAISLYQTIFNNWNVNSEKITFQNIIYKMPANDYPQLIFTNNGYPDKQSESWTFITDYILNIKFHIQNEDSIYSYAGTMQLIIKYKKDLSGWYIKSWIDSNPSNDSIKSTWSILKAQFVK